MLLSGYFLSVESNKWLVVNGIIIILVSNIKCLHAGRQMCESRSEAKPVK